MKYLGTIFLLFLAGSLKAQVSVDTSGLTINFNKIARLQGGAGFFGVNKTGTIKQEVKDGVVLLKLTTSGNISAKEYVGVFFNNIPNLKKGVTLWRYKPWNSWTKPVSLTDATKMAEWDVQFFYWQYVDGLYGAAVPVSGNGFRTTLGSTGNFWGSKAVSYAENANTAEVPGMAIAFGKDPYDLFARVYKTALTAMGKSDNLLSKKTLPEPLKYIGWCTWNSSDMGKNLDEAHIIKGVKTFTDKKFTLGWVLIDDGWFQHKNSQLQSLRPDPKKFPNGFKPLIDKLKNNYGIKYTGVWHAFNGYWNGIDPDSELGRQYKDRLFSWTQRERVEVPGSENKTYHFINPEGDNLYKFYSTLHSYLKNEGFDFIKVDNQLVTERMAVDNYPLFTLSGKMHEALYKSSNKYFNGALINCMDMTAEAYLNFGTSAVARTVEDYFPYEKGETYDMQRGNAAAHVLQAIYNSIYFSQMVYTDYDMFESHNPNAVFHAIARTLNNGPIYLTDKPGEQNFGILNSITFADGRSIRAETSLLPTVDCLFAVQDAGLFKAFTKVRNTGLLALYNVADADRVEGSFKPADVDDLKGEQFAVYEYFTKKLWVAKSNESFKVALPRMGYQIEYVVPIKNGFAPFGLINKYNAPATIIAETQTGNTAEVTLYEGGEFKAYAAKKPKNLLINGKPHSFAYVGKMISVKISSLLKKPVVLLKW